MKYSNTSSKSKESKDHLKMYLWFFIILGEISETQLPDGSVYTGVVVRGIPNGEGKLLRPSWEIYEGNWIDGMLEGRGRIFYRTGDTYSGNVHRNQRHGYGVMTFSCGIVYSGYWKNNIVLEPVIMESNVDGQKIAWLFFMVYQGISLLISIIGIILLSRVVSFHNSKQEGKESECCICMAARFQIAFIPCGHLCVCQQCSISVDYCPVCRKNIEDRVQIFY